MRLLIPCLLAAALACAQSTAQLEIRGTVVEGTLGIGGVTVTLYEFGHTPAESTTRTVFATTSTDSQGAFIFHPTRLGEYYVEVQKNGYFAESYNGPTVDPVDSTGDAVTIDANHPLQQRKFSLMRLGELRGRVVDEDGNPLANLRVVIRPGMATPVVTDQDGYFTATKLRPGDYVASVSHKGPEILPQFSEKDLKIVDQDWDASSWPGTPLSVSPGASLSVGTITPRKAEYYRAHLSVDPGDCAPGEQWMFSTEIEMAGFGPQVPCGKEFLVRNLAPGSYTFTLSAGGRPEENKKLAFASVEVTDRNLDVALTMSAGADISGQVEAADGAALPRGKMAITVGPVGARFNRSQMTETDPTGTFLIRALPGTRQRVSVFGLTSKFYVKEIRYNGLDTADGIFTPVPGFPAQLEIVIDDKPATISGSVADRDKVNGGVRVVAMKWPVPSDADSFSALLNPSAGSMADEHGRFQIVGLAPGEYRVLAITVDSLSRLRPDVLNRAETVTLERGGSQSVSLKIVEP